MVGGINIGVEEDFGIVESIGRENDMVGDVFDFDDIFVVIIFEGFDFNGGNVVVGVDYMFDDGVELEVEVGVGFGGVKVGS